jgi:hypothetical protein
MEFGVAEFMESDSSTELRLAVQSRRKFALHDFVACGITDCIRSHGGLMRLAVRIGVKTVAEADGR